MKQSEPQRGTTIPVTFLEQKVTPRGNKVSRAPPGDTRQCRVRCLSPRALSARSLRALSRCASSVCVVSPRLWHHVPALVAPRICARVCVCLLPEDALGASNGARKAAAGEEDRAQGEGRARGEGRASLSRPPRPAVMVVVMLTVCARVAEHGNNWTRR